MARVYSEAEVKACALWWSGANTNNYELTRCFRLEGEWFPGGETVDFRYTSKHTPVHPNIPAAAARRLRGIPFNS